MCLRSKGKIKRVMNCLKTGNRTSLVFNLLGSSVLSNAPRILLKWGKFVKLGSFWDMPMELQTNAGTVEIVFDITPLSFDPPPSEFGPKSGYDYDKLFDSFDLPDVSKEDSEVVYTHLVNKDEVDASWRIPNAAAQTTSGDLYVDFSAYLKVNASSGNDQASSSNANAEWEIQSNLGNTLQAPAIPVPRTNIHHPVDNIIGNPNAGVQTRRSISEMQCLFSATKKEEIYNLSLHECFISQIKPKNYQMALKDNSWCEAMQEELAQFDKLKVWNLVDLPKGQHAITTIPLNVLNCQYHSKRLILNAMALVSDTDSKTDMIPLLRFHKKIISVNMFLGLTSLI
ncbi:hypothetical protein HanHA89_Chr10g0397871 [Helianthus annuus]|nr:hypothetical protein HanHA89_Chr10g0397871 [Helianthus annuus]